MKEWIKSRFGPGGAGLLIPVVVLSLAGSVHAAPYTQGPPGPLDVTRPSILFPPTPLHTTFSYARATDLGDISKSAVTISSITITGTNASDFAVSSGCVGVTLNPGVLCPMVVSFTPSANGDRVATLVITPNSGSPLNIGLYGYGGLIIPAAGGGGGGGGVPAGTFISGMLSVSPSPVVFPSANHSSGNSIETVILSNTATTLLAITGVSITGTNASDFKIIKDSGGIGFAQGGFRFITIQFSPSIVGAESATLVVKSSTAGSPTMVALTGTGT